MLASKAQRVASEFNGRLYRAKGVFKAAEVMAKHMGMHDRAEDIEVIGREVTREIEHKRDRQLLEFKPIIVVTGAQCYDDIIVGTAPDNNGKRTKKTVKLKNVLRCWLSVGYLELETKTRRYLLTLKPVQLSTVIHLLRELGISTPWKFDR